MHQHNIKYSFTAVCNHLLKLRSVVSRCRPCLIHKNADFDTMQRLQFRGCKNLHPLLFNDCDFAPPYLLTMHPLSQICTPYYLTNGCIEKSTQGFKNPECKNDVFAYSTVISVPSRKVTVISSLLFTVRKSTKAHHSPLSNSV